MCILVRTCACVYICLHVVSVVSRLDIRCLCVRVMSLSSVPYTCSTSVCVCMFLCVYVCVCAHKMKRFQSVVI